MNKLTYRDGKLIGMIKGYMHGGGTSLASDWNPETPDQDREEIEMYAELVGLAVEFRDGAIYIHKRDEPAPPHS